MSVWGKGIILVLGCFALIATWTLRPSQKIQGRVIHDVEGLGGQIVGQPLPPLELFDVHGQKVELSAFRGKVIFLNLWASWCEPCRDELPSLLSLANHLSVTAPRDFVMIAVSWDDDPEELARFIAAVPGIEEQVLIAVDPGGELTSQLGTRLLPETFLVDRSGLVVARFQNKRKWDTQIAVRMISALIHQSP